MDSYTPYIYKGKKILIQRYLVLEEALSDREKYDIFRMEMDPVISDIIHTPISTDSYPMFDDLTYEGFSTLKKFDEHKVYLYTQIVSKSKAKVFVNAMCCTSKLWLNEKCLCIHSENAPTSYWISTELEKGVNHLVLEMFAICEDKRFSIQITNYQFEMSTEFSAISNIPGVMIDPFIVVHDPFYMPVGDTFRFMYMKNGGQLQSEYRIDIHDSTLGLVKSLPARLNEPVTIDASELRQLHEETLRHEWFACYFKNKAGTAFTHSFPIVVTHYLPKAEEIIGELSEVIAEQASEVYNYCQAKINRQREYGLMDMIKYWFSWNCRDALIWIKNNTFPFDIYRTRGAWEWFVPSSLDDSIVRIGVRIPPNYDENKIYPAFIALSTGNEGWYSWLVDQVQLSEPCLSFDVSGRGFTGGSYTGEASTLEILDWIRKNFRIDEERLYIVGGSNGGYATYAFAQNHPHIPAAIYPCASTPFWDTVTNISNIPTYQLVSPEDYVYKGHVNAVKQRIGSFGNYNQFDFSGMLHSHLCEYFRHPKILEEMLKHRRNRYPKQILFKTYRNRHSESFWIKLHGIAPGKKSAQLKAEMLNDREIRVSIHNAVGFTLTIPPQMSMDYFTVSINGQTFALDHPAKTNITFVKKRKWQMSDSIPTVDFRKGTGILDVYLKSLRLIIPTNATKALQNVADHFAHPYTNGFDPQIYVYYPVYTANQVPAHIFGHNLILFDQMYQNPYVDRLKGYFPIQYNDEGFVYQGNHYIGDYSIMQVIPNPYDNRLSILIVSYNSEDSLRKNVFLRKVILPFYLNGLHPYLNNEILIFFQDKFYAAYEKESPLELIE